MGDTCTLGSALSPGYWAIIIRTLTDSIQERKGVDSSISNPHPSSGFPLQGSHSPSFSVPAGCLRAQGLLCPSDHLDRMHFQLSHSARDHLRGTGSQDSPHTKTPDPGWQWEGLERSTGLAGTSG